MTWAQPLKRVFGIDIDTCARCGGKLKVIASIEEPDVIAKILAHLEMTAAQQRAGGFRWDGGRDTRRSARKPGIRPSRTMPAGRERGEFKQISPANCARVGGLKLLSAQVSGAGLLLADIATGGTPSVDVSIYKYGRFTPTDRSCNIAPKLRCCAQRLR
jgi:hypothetical protein